MSFFTNKDYRENKILNWMNIGLILFVTGFIWMPKRDGLQTIFALFFLLPVLYTIPFRKPEFTFYGGWASLLAIIFATYSVVTSFWAPISKVDFFVIQWFVLVSWLLGVSWLASQREINWNQLQELLLLIGALVGIMNLFSFYGSNPLSVRMEGFLIAKNPNEVGALFGILSLLAFCQWLRSYQIKEVCHYGLLSLLLSFPLLLSQSRGALVALIVTGLMAIFYIRPSRNKSILLLGFGLIIVIGILLNRELLTGDRFAMGFRDIIWQEIFSRSVNEHFWFGIGMEKFEKIIIPDVDVFDHAHNVWLDTFYHTGFIGLILGLLHVFYVLQKFKPTPLQISFYLWLMFGLIASMLDYRTFFWQIDFKWFLFWIPVGLISAVQIQEMKKFSCVIPN
jgi:O-Antigen ligase